MPTHSGSPHSDRPNLSQKRKLAKELLKAVNRLDGSNAARFTWNHPRFRGKTAQDVIREGVSLSEAQHVIARESGFESWPKLKEYTQQLEADPNGAMAVFEDAVRFTIRGDIQNLRRLLETNPETATMRSMRQHGCVLLHYVAANGVENEHQRVPPNAPEIARLLIEAGAASVIDATANIYGGGAGSTPLVALVSSAHPHEAGVQAELVKVFCKAGAKINGIDDDGLPLSIALGFRYPQAAKSLATLGARVDNLPAAAGVGNVELVRNYLDVSKGLVSETCHFPNPRHNPFPKSQAPHPDKTLQQALVFACMAGHVSIAQLLLDSGVDINAGPRHGITALHECCYQGQAEAAHWLVQHGADPSIRDANWDSTAIGWASGGGQKALMEWLFEDPKVDFLDAVEYRKYALVRRLLEADSTLANGPMGSGAALRYAAARGDVRMAQLLVDFHADPDLANENGHSAVDYAEKSGNREMQQLLRAARKNRGE